MQWIFSDTLAVIDRTAWEQNVEALNKYLRRNHEDTLEQLKMLYPRTWSSHTLRPVPFVWRVARELATLYRKRPNREFIGEAITPEMQDRIRDIYRALDLDLKMRTLQENLVALNNACMFFFPVVKRDFQGVQPVIIPPHHTRFQMKKGQAMSLDMLDVERVWLKLPVHTDATTGMINYGVAVITETQAYWEDAPDQSLIGQGLWFADKSNPLGRIPAIYLRGTEPKPGEWTAPTDDDLLAAQRAISLGFTDLGQIARLQGYMQGVMTNMTQQQAESLEVGPESIIGLMEDQSFNYVGGKPPLKDNLENLIEYMNTMLAHLGLNPQTFLKTASVSAIAKQVDLIDREAERQRFVIMFEDAENKAWEFIRGWINELRGNGQVIYPFARVEVEYFEPAIPVDVLHTAQAERMQIHDGTLTAAQILAKRSGISMEEAREQVRLNLEETRETLEILEPDERVAQGRTPESERELSVL